MRESLIEAGVDATALQSRLEDELLGASRTRIELTTVVASPQEMAA